jgi:hypothetical protein
MNPYRTGDYTGAKHVDEEAKRIMTTTGTKYLYTAAVNCSVDRRTDLVLVQIIHVE